MVLPRDILLSRVLVAFSETVQGVYLQNIFLVEPT